jgi:hypothetical protein
MTLGGYFTDNAYIETPVLGRAMTRAAELGVDGFVLLIT